MIQSFNFPHSKRFQNLQFLYNCVRKYFASRQTFHVEMEIFYSQKKFLQKRFYLFMHFSEFRSYEF